MKKQRITPAQIKIIHIAVHELGLDDDLYRAMLHNLFGVASCRDLSAHQAHELIEHLKSGGFVIREKPRAGGDNVIHLTTPAQRRLINVLADRFPWRRRNGYALWLQRQEELGNIKSAALNQASDARWVIEKLKLMTHTSTDNIIYREAPVEMG